MSKKSKKLIKKFKKFIEKAKIKNLGDYVKQSAKTDGVSEGGIYSLTTQNPDGSEKITRYMLKKMDPYSMAAEYVGSHIAKLYVGNSAPTVDLVKGNDGSVYVASEFIPNFQTLKDFSAKLGIPKECFPYGCVADQNGVYHPIAPHLQQVLNSHITNKSVSDAEKVNMVAEFLQHDDTHDRNIGIRVDNKAGPVPTIDLKASAIDWSWSLRGNNPNSPIVYYSNSYDPQKVVSAIDQIVDITPKEIETLTAPLFDNLKECYGSKTVFNGGISPRNYLRHLVSLVVPSWTPNLDVDGLKLTMISSLEKRSQKLIDEKVKLENSIAHDHTHQMPSQPIKVPRKITTDTAALPLADIVDQHNNVTLSSGGSDMFTSTAYDRTHESFEQFLSNHQSPNLPNPYDHTRLLANGTVVPNQATNISNLPIVGTVALAALAVVPLLRKAMKSTTTENSSTKGRTKVKKTTSHTM